MADVKQSSAAPAGRPGAPKKSVVQDIRSLVVSLPYGEDGVIEAVERLSHSRRALAPLALTAGAFAMLFDGLRVLASNWRLMVIEILPAAWIWIAMYDIRARLIHQHPVPQVGGFWLAVALVAITLITTVSFYLNGVFGFAVADSPPDLARGFAGAAASRWALLIPGLVVGAMLACSALLAPALPRPWPILSLGAVVGLMMVCYVAVPARAIGLRRNYKRTDKWVMTAISSTIGVIVMFPAYVLGRVGLLMIGSPLLRPFGIAAFAVAIVLEIGATGAVRAVKLGSALTAGETGAESAPRG